MFETLAEFSAVYLLLASAILALIAFEKPLLAMEDKYDKRKEMRRNEHLKNASGPRKGK